MTPPSRASGRPGRRLPAVPILLLCASALAGCAHLEKPPEIAYDDAAPATLKVDPLAPVTVVELPKPLPLPGQLEPVERGRPTPEAVDPTARVALANAAARMQPVRNGFINAVQIYLLPLTVPEIRHLLAAVVGLPPPDTAAILRWSVWRRRHQQRARRAHWRQRTRKATRSSKKRNARKTRL